MHVDHVAESLNKSADRRLETVLTSIKDQGDKSQETAGGERLLKSLKFQGMNERRNHITHSHPKTFGWVVGEGFEESSSDSESYSGSKDSHDVTEDRSQDLWDSFPDWLRSTANVYWISGKPGSGKSTLIRYLVAAKETLIISHFLWRPGTALQQSIKGLLLSLLHQLLASLECFGENVRLLVHKDHDTDWSATELQRLLFDVLEHHGRPIAMFLDGLDEVLPEDGVP